MIDLNLWVERISSVALIGFLLVYGFWQGLQFHSFTLDLFLVELSFSWLEAAFSAFGFALFFLVSSTVFFLRLYLWNGSGGEAEGSVLCVVPCYQDSEALSRSIKSLISSWYEDFEVLIVCEEEDNDTIREAERLSDEFQNVRFAVNQQSGSKAGAINFAVRRSESDFIAMFDADQRVSEDFLGKMVREAQNVDVVQARNIPLPNGLVESFCYYESVFFTYISRQFLSSFTGFSLVGSRSVLMHREAFEKVGGYEEMLTEDYDFAHKCYVNRIEVSNVPICVENLAAHDFRDWWGQRKRWMKGYFQVFLKRIKEMLANYQNYRSILSVLVSGGSLLGSFLMLTLVSKFLILMLLGASGVYSAPLIAMSFIALAFRTYDWRAGEVSYPKLSWLFVPLIFPLFGLITVKSFFEFAFGRQLEWYSVEK